MVEPQQKRVLRSLVGLHAVQTAHSRLWSFAVPMVFATLDEGGESLASLARFTTAIQVANFCAAPFLGALADSLSLSHVAMASVLGHVAVVLNCLILLSGQAADISSGALFSVVLGGAAVELLQEFSSIALTMRIAPMSSSGENELARVNSLVRQAELLVKVVVPLAFGCYASYSKALKPLACLVLGAHILSSCVSASLWRKTLQFESLPFGKAKKDEKLEQTASSVATPVTGMSLAFALLFCSVLSDHDPFFTAHLMAAGIAPGMLGSARSFGALAGLLGTWLWPWLQSRMGTLRGASASLFAFVLCVAMVLPCLQNPYLALVFVMLSRPFLWAFDLAMITILQELVSPKQRGKAAGLQNMAIHICEIAIASATMAFPRADQFWTVSGISLAAVSASAVLFLASVLCWEQRTVSL